MAALIVKLGEYELSRHRIEQTETTIGRASDCDIVIDNVGISRVHAIVRTDGLSYSIHDAGRSKNGLYYNERLIRELRLVDGAEIVMGKFTLVFDAEGRALGPLSVPPRGRAERIISTNPEPTMQMPYTPYVTARPPRPRRVPQHRLLLWLFVLTVFLAALAARLRMIS